MRVAEITVAAQRSMKLSQTQRLQDTKHEHPDNKVRRRPKPKPRPFNEPKPDNLS